ncbi:MAG: DNA repair protein RadC [Burkholderiaceae bacterium]
MSEPPRLSLRDWPASERPRERLIAEGTARLTDAELLAVFLRTGVPGRHVIDLARQTLARFGSLHALLTSGIGEFCEVDGLGPAKWAVLQASVEMTRRSLAEQLRDRDALTTPRAVRDFLSLWLRDRPHEVFAVLFLDSQHRLLAAEELFRGTLNQAAVYPREVARRALQLNAAALILAHNHPSGVAQASAADRLLTDRLKATMAALDIPVLDHLIIAGNASLSFAEKGWL